MFFSFLIVYRRAFLSASAAAGFIAYGSSASSFSSSKAAPASGENFTLGVADADAEDELKISELKLTSRVVSIRETESTLCSFDSSIVSLSDAATSCAGSLECAAFSSASF